VAQRVAQEREAAVRDGEAIRRAIGLDADAPTTSVLARLTETRPDLLPLFDSDPKAAMARMFPDEAKPTVVPQGAAVFQGGREVFKNPKAPEETAIERHLRSAGIDPKSPDGQRYMMQALNKAVTHAPAAQQTVHTGTMVPVEGPNGPMYVMPTKTGGVTEVPGLKPPGSARAEAADTANTQSALDRSSSMLNKIDSALKKVGFMTTAIPGAVAGKVPGTDAYDLRAEVQTIQANFGFQELAQMRASSPTGGALGSIAVKELELLQSAVQNLDPNQSTEQLRKNLQAAKQHVTNWRNAVQMAAGKRPMVPGAAPATASPPDTTGAGGWSIKRVP
jgi:hypothetical protein